MIVHDELLDTYRDTAIISGGIRGGFIELSHFVEQERAATLVAFTGRNSVDQNGAWYKLMRISRKNYMNIVRFADIEPEPEVGTVERMVNFLIETEPDSVLAIGGGSVMDAAKAAYLVYQAGGKVQDYFGSNMFSGKNPGKTLNRVICVPTTAGTGSEVTPYSCIVDKTTSVKKLIFEKEIIPKFSFLIPELTSSMSRELTLATGADALAHLIEGFLNVTQDENCGDANTRALAGIKLIVENLPRVIDNGNDFEARQAMSVAACLGGMVIRSKSTGLPHLCSFSWYGLIPHGLAVAALLPYCWQYYLGSSAVAERTLELHEIFGVEGDRPEDVIAGYCEFVKSCGIELTLKKIPGISKKLLTATARSAAQNEMKLRLAPRPVQLEEAPEVLGQILENSWNGKI